MPLEQAQELQVALGSIRTTRGHFADKLLAIDPHRLKSYTRRRMRLHPLSAQFCDCLTGGFAQYWPGLWLLDASSTRLI